MDGTAPDPEHHQPMGAVPGDGETSFRVWAPHADAVAVRGSFTGWSEATPLAAEGNGCWSVVLPGVGPGAEYRFQISYGGQLLDRIDPYAQQVTREGAAVVYDHASFDWGGDRSCCPSQSQLVIYEATWAPVGAAGDGLVGRLDHIADLGVNAIQLLPVTETGQAWVEQTGQVFAISPAHGGPDALKTLVREAHRRGLAVIWDVAYHHLGPVGTGLWRYDGWGADGYGGIYYYNDQRARTPWGPTRPDFGRPEVQRMLLDNALMWLRDYHLDGLRYDHTGYLYSVDGTGFELSEGWDLVRRLNQTVRAELPDRVLVAEDLPGHSRITATSDDGALFHAQWDAHFLQSVRRALEASSDRDRSVVEVRDAIGSSYGDPLCRVIYAANHDELAEALEAAAPEDPVAAWAERRRAALAVAVVLTSPGIPMLVEGQVSAAGLDDAVTSQGRNPYQDLARLRRNWFGQTRGLRGAGLFVHHTNDDQNLIAWQRWDRHGAGDDVVVVANLSAEPRSGYRIGMPGAGQWRLRFSCDDPAYPDSAGHCGGDIEAYEGRRDQMDAHAEISIGGYSLQVYSQDV